MNQNLSSRISLWTVALAVIVTTLVILFTVTAQAAPSSGAFVSFATGSVNGQFGWTMEDSFGNSTHAFDQEIEDASDSVRVLRMSNAVTSSGYSDQIFSSTTALAAGETDSSLWNDYGSDHTSPNNPPHFGANAASTIFYSSMTFRSATGAAQTGLNVTLSPSAKQSTTRMSYLKIEDTGAGFDLVFYDTDAAGDFVGPTTVATGLAYSDSHTVGIAITFVDGEANDVVEVFVNGALAHSGTTWEGYYFTTEAEWTVPSEPRLQAVNSMLFRLSGTAQAAHSGAGFEFTDFEISNTIDPCAGAGGDADDDGICDNSDNCTDVEAINFDDPANVACTYNVNNLANGTGYATIQEAIDAASAGDTISVSAGVYVENVNVDKKITLIGAGSGSDDTSNTILREDNNAAVVTLSGSGDSAVDPVLIQDLRIEPSNAYGINVGSVSFIKLDNVHVVGTEPMNDTESEVGLKVSTTSNVSGLEVVDSAFDKLSYGWYFAKHGDWGPGGSNVTDVTVENTSFSDNSAKGLYVEKLSDATFSGCIVVDNGGDSAFWNAVWNGGFDINLKGEESYQNIEVLDCVFTGNGLGLKEGAALMIKARDDGGTYGAHPATLDGVTLSGNVITGNERGVRFGEPDKDNAGPTNVVVSGNSISANVQTYGDSDGSSYGDIVDQTIAGNVIDASGNWLGSNDASIFTTGIAGNVDYTPWLDSGTDSDLGSDGFQADFSVLHVDDDSPQTGSNGRIQEAIDVADSNTINVAAGTYAEDIIVDKPLTLRDQTSAGGFSNDLAVAEDQESGYWYPDRYPPAVFETAELNGEQTLKHGVRVADSSANRPSNFSSTFYDTQGYKLDTNLDGMHQSMQIDIWVPSDWATSDRYAGIWATGFDATPEISAYPILQWRSNGVTPGFYGWDYADTGSWILLLEPEADEYDQWYTLKFELTVGSAFEYFINGQSMTMLDDVDTTSLGNLILNVGNYGEDYDVYWDNLVMESDGPATFEPTIDGHVTIDSSDVTLTGFFITNPGETRAVLVDDAMPSHSDISITHNRIQDVGSDTLSSNLQGIYVERGPDNVTVAHNVFSNLQSTRSVDGLFVGDTSSDDDVDGLVVTNNVFKNIVAGRGGYGVLIANGGGAGSGAANAPQITHNSFDSIEGSWTHAVGLEGPTPNAVVIDNTFDNLTATTYEAAAVFFQDNSGGGTVAVECNQFQDTSAVGVGVHPEDLPGGVNSLSYVVDADSNWWGDVSGPSGEGAGSGALVGEQVTFAPWSLNPECTIVGETNEDGVVVLPDDATTEQVQDALDALPPGSEVLLPENGTFSGLVSNGVLIYLNGSTVGPGSPALTCNLPNGGFVGPGVLDGTGDLDSSPAVLVQDGADNCRVENLEIRNWTDGVKVEENAVVDSIKIRNNWIHDNVDAAIQIDSGATINGLVTIEGNLFKDNAFGVRHDGTNNPLDVSYNSWGTYDAPVAGTDYVEDVATSVTTTPHTYVEFYMDVDLADGVDDSAELLVNDVIEDDTFDVELKMDVQVVNAFEVIVNFPTDLLTLNSDTLASPWNGLATDGSGSGNFCSEGGTHDESAGIVHYICVRVDGNDGPVGMDQLISTLNFTADVDATHDGENGPWAALLDIEHDTVSAGAKTGVKVYVNNAGFGDASDPLRDLTEDPVALENDHDGRLNITGLANFYGFIDLQGRGNDSGATFSVYDAAGRTTLLATGSSASGGRYESAYVAGNQLTIGSTYYLLVDAPLYVPTTRPSVDLDESALLDTRTLTGLNNVLLLGGDASNNDVIDVSDLACIGGDYGQAADICSLPGSSSDVNGDGSVDIFDLALMGGNYSATDSAWTPE